MFNDTPKFEDYEILSELGKGTQGKVYKVRWKKRNREVFGALKFLNSSEVKKILKEVSTWARVSQHPNILTFITADEDNGRFFIISELASEGDLEKWIEEKGGKEEFFDEAIEIMLGILRGLEHLHQNDIVHRDIKPANIFLKDKTPLLADFGLARGLDLKQSNSFGGTLLYMSPELINVYLSLEAGSKLNYERTELDDLWAVAVAFQQMLTDKMPFKTIDAIRMCQPNPLSIKVSAIIEDFLKTAFAKNSSERFQTAEAMSVALTKAVKIIDKETIIDEDFDETEPTKDWQEIEAKKERQRKLAEANRLKEAKHQQDKLNAIWQRLKPQTLSQLTSKSAVNYFAIADDCFTKKDYDGAIKNFTKAIELKPDYADAYNKRGLTYDSKGNYDQAIKDQNKAIELNPNFATAYYDRGNAYNDKGNYDQAIEDYTKAIQLKPDFVKNYDNRGIAYHFKGNYDQAIEDFTKAIELNPDFADAYNNRGVSYNHKGNYDQAIKDLNKAIELNPDFAIAYNNRGNAYSKKGNHDQAIANYRKALQIDPNHKNAKANIESLLPKYQTPNQKSSSFWKWIFGGVSGLVIFIGGIIGINSLINIDKPRIANILDNPAGNAANRPVNIASNGTKSTNNIPNVANILTNTADSKSSRDYFDIAYDCAEKKDYDCAIKNYTKAIELNPNYANAYNNRGSAYDSKGNYDQAISDYRKALQIDPNVKNAKANLEIVLKKRNK